MARRDDERWYDREFKGITGRVFDEEDEARTDPAAAAGFKGTSEEPVMGDNGPLIVSLAIISALLCLSCGCYRSYQLLSMLSFECGIGAASKTRKE